MVDFLNCFQIIFAIGYMMFIRPWVQSIKFEAIEMPRIIDMLFFSVLFLISAVRYAK